MSTSKMILKLKYNVSDDLLHSLIRIIDALGEPISVEFPMSDIMYVYYSEGIRIERYNNANSYSIKSYSGFMCFDDAVREIKGQLCRPQN